VIDRRALVRALALPPLLVWLGCAGPSNPIPTTHTGVAELGAAFRSETAVVNGARLHYVRGGAGPALFLVHGFPQDWFAFRAVMPRLAARYTVVAVDLRGVGGSSGPIDPYDPATLARDLRELARTLGLASIYLADAPHRLDPHGGIELLAQPRHVGVEGALGDVAVRISLGARQEAREARDATDDHRDRSAITSRSLGVT
jgi:hypothetical protein